MEKWWDRNSPTGVELPSNRRFRHRCGLHSGNTHAHAALLGALLELDAELVEAPARSLEVVYGDADVAKATAGLLVTRVVLEVGVVLWAHVSEVFSRSL